MHNKVIGIDLETRDPNLMTMGPGAVRNDGYVLGVALYYDDKNIYIPLRHESGNADRAQTIKFLQDLLGDETPKVGANILYDLEWLKADLGITVRGPKYDVQIAEWLLDEEKFSYRLEVLCQQYLGKSKTEDKLKEAGQRLGISEKEIKSNLWRMSVEDVSEYAKADAKDVVDIWNIQKDLLAKEELQFVFYEMEVPMIDVLLAMRFKGVPVDVDKSVEVRDILKEKEDFVQKELNKLAMQEVDVWSGQVIAQAAAKLGLPIPYTTKGNPSFESAWLEERQEPFFKMVSAVRKFNRSGSVFIEKKILEMMYNGKVYPTFRQSKTDDGGTKSGRFASANPNMQQVPSRDKELAPLIRSLFIPEPGCMWGKFDYKQQEPRVTVNYAYMSNLPGAKEAHDAYLKNPNIDYHQMVADMANIPRSTAKTMNLGLAYGMGKAKMADQLGVTFAEASSIYEQYHSRVPFIKGLTNKASNLAEQRGYIRTISGRRKRFDLWGPKRYVKGVVPKSKAEAQAMYEPPLVRYFTYRAMNSLIQGSSADMTKLAMIDMYRAGYVPSLTVHDEVDDTTITSDAQVKEITDIMINCLQNHNLKMHVPLLVDVSVGKSWGEAEKV